MSQINNTYTVGIAIEDHIHSFSEMEIRPAIDNDRIFLEPDPIAEKIRRKMMQNGILYSELLENESIDMRAGLAQLYKIEADWKNTKSSNSIPILFGKNIQRYKIEETLREFYIDKNHEFCDTYKDQISRYAEPHIEMQRIFSHTQNEDLPFALLKASFVDDDIIPIYTTTCIYPNSEKFDLFFILGVLNSRIISYFAWKFIFCNAIRSMDLYEMYLRKLPIPNADTRQQKEVSSYSKKLHKHVKKIPINPDIKNYFIEPEIKKITLKDYVQNKKGTDIKINDQSTLGRLMSYELSIKNNWIIFNVKYILKNSRAARDLEILRVKEENPAIQDYLLYNFKKKKKNLSSTEKNLYNILIDEKLPSYGQTIDEHFDKTCQMLGKFYSEKKEYEKWLDVFKKLDLKIDMLISSLFGLNPSEFQAIMKNSRPDWHIGIEKR